MTAAPSDAFQVSSSTALEMAEGLMRTLNTIIKHLPEHELRTMRDTLEISLYTADDLLIGMTLPSDLETLTINGTCTTPSVVLIPTSSRTVVAADSPPPLSPVSVTADCSVVAKPDDELVIVPPPTYSIIVSSRPNVGQPDYTLHPAFVKPGIPGPYVRPPVDPTKPDPTAYHVITKGLYVGIFTSWVLCSPWVTRVAGNTHFKVANWAEAMELYNSCLASGACEVLS